MNTLRHFTQFYLFALIFSFLGLIACTETETEVFGSVYGSVYDAVTHDAIQTADVTINPGGKKTVTGSDGRFEYTNLEPGQYSLTITKNGYQTNSGKVTVIANEASPFELLLKPGESYLRINKTSINYGTNNIVDGFNINNAGKSPLSWSIQNETDWISKIEPRQGTTEAGKITPVSVTIDRSKLEKGKTISSSILIMSDAGTESIEIIAEGSEPDPVTPDPTPNITAGLIAYYSFDNGDAKDTAGNGLHGVFLNGVEVIDNTPSGKGKAIFINGTKNQCVTVPTSIFPFKQLPEYSISMWAKDYSGVALLFTAVSISSASSFPCLYSTSDNKYRFVPLQTFSNEGGYFNYIHTNNQDKWHMITIVLKSGSNSNSNIQELYINGDLVDSVSNSYGKTEISATKFQIGGNADGIFSDAMSSMKIDNVRLYNRALTAKDVKEIYDYERAY